MSLKKTKFKKNEDYQIPKQNEQNIENLKWSSDKVEVLKTKMIETGYKPKVSPFYENNINYKKGNIIFEFKTDEVIEMTKCANDIIYFAEKYCKIKQKGGIKTVKLRDYQKRLLTSYTSKDRYHLTLSSR